MARKRSSHSRLPLSQLLRYWRSFAEPQEAPPRAPFTWQSLYGRVLRMTRRQFAHGAASPHGLTSNSSSSEREAATLPQLNTPCDILRSHRARHASGNVRGLFEAGSRASGDNGARREDWKKGHTRHVGLHSHRAGEPRPRQAATVGGLPALPSGTIPLDYK